MSFSKFIPTLSAWKQNIFAFDAKAKSNRVQTSMDSNEIRVSWTEDESFSTKPCIEMVESSTKSHEIDESWIMSHDDPAVIWLRSEVFNICPLKWSCLFKSLFINGLTIMLLLCHLTPKLLTRCIFDSDSFLTSYLNLLVKIKSHW